MLRDAGGRGYRVGVINPLTLVGKEILSILRERGFPAEEVRLLDSTGAEDGSLMEGIDEPIVVRPADENELSGLDLVFFCGTAAENERWIALRLELGFVAIDLTQPSMQHSSGPVVVADLNSDSVGEDASLIVSPHPVSTVLSLVLSPILERSEIDLCMATIIEPASQLDQRGIDEMFAQTVAVLNVQPLPSDVFARQAAFNLFPATGGTEMEDYVTAQIEMISEGHLPVTLQFIQGATFHNHSISLYLQLGDDLLDEELASLLAESPMLNVAELDETFGTVDSGGRDEILVGRIRKAPGVEGGFWLYVVADNLRRSSALNAVLIAEHLVERFGHAPN